MGFDRRAGRVVAVTNAGDGFETWTFDVCANTWTQMHPSREPPSFDWARLVYDVDSDVTILVAYGASAHPWVYDLQANTWTEMGAAPTYAIPWAYDPLSGLVVAAAPPLLWNYDVETDRWTPIRQVNGEGCGPCTYDASVDRIVALGDGLFDIRTGRWSKSDADAPHVLDWLTFPAITYDEAAKRTVVGGNVRLAAYDATADRWETVEFPDPDLWSGVSMVYDSVNERLLVLPDYWAEWTDGTLVGDVLALDLTTGEWTVLLELIDGQ